MPEIPLSDLTDRELLVLAVTRINTVCIQVNEHDDKIDAIETECASRKATCDEKERQENKNSSRTMWSVGILVSLILGLFGLLKDFFVK